MVLSTDYPKEMVWRANLAAMFVGGDRFDLLHDIYCFVKCDGLTLEQAYAKTCYRNSPAGIKGKFGDADLIVNHTDHGNSQIFKDYSDEDSIDALLDIKAAKLSTTEHLILYLLANNETGTAISKALGCSVKTAIRKIKQLREKLERVIR